MSQQGVYPLPAQHNLKQVFSGPVLNPVPESYQQSFGGTVVAGGVALATVGSLSICAWTSLEACTNLSLAGQWNHRDPAEPEEGPCDIHCMQAAPWQSSCCWWMPFYWRLAL